MDQAGQTLVGTGSANVQELVALQQVAQRCGRNPIVAGVLITVGLVPTVVATTVRGPGYSDAAMISALFLVVPLVLLIGWTFLDREGQAARELTMWLQSVQRSSLLAGPESGPIAATASIAWRQRSFHDVNGAFRTALAPFVRAGRGLQARIILYRFWYPIVWSVVALALIALFGLIVGLTPECGSIDPGPGSICH